MNETKSLTIPNGGTLSGQITIPPSKSFMHRLIICTALSGGGTIKADSLCDDTLCTLNSLSALGYDYYFECGKIDIFPGKLSDNIEISESGSTLRFMLSVISAMAKKEVTITLGQRLAQRPILPLIEVLNANGAEISLNENKITIGGKLKSGKYTIDGSISSQFISGLLLALPLLAGDSEIIPTGKAVSESYIDITLSVLREYGIKAKKSDNGYLVGGGQKYIFCNSLCEGDYSTAAFFAVGAAIGGRCLTLKGLNRNSPQGDRAITEILSRMGADIALSESEITVSGGKLHAIDYINCENIPDLVPILALACATAEGTSTLGGIERLKYKESDRISSTLEMIMSLGGDIKLKDNAFVIEGKNKLAGGSITTCGDHRIAMTAAISALVCTTPVTIDNSDCVSKSCPDFFDLFSQAKH